MRDRGPKDQYIMNDEETSLKQFMSNTFTEEFLRDADAEYRVAYLEGQLFELQQLYKKVVSQRDAALFEVQRSIASSRKALALLDKLLAKDWNSNE